jgi:triacylglycerol lipase
MMPTLRHPIVFVHGLLGFDYLRLGRWRLACYWSTLPEAVKAASNRVFVAKVSPLGSVAERARQLKDYLDENCPRQQVHIVGHSMGGLDARYMISKLGMASRVLSLTTIATPHRGTPFADWGLRRLGPVFRAFFDLFGFSPRAIEDLSVAACRRFNDEVADASGVRYFSVGGQFESSWRTPAWHLSWRVIQQEQGANDGLVPVASAHHGEEFSLWDGNHISLINFTGPLARAIGCRSDRTPAYAGLLRRVAAAEC